MARITGRKGDTTMTADDARMIREANSRHFAEQRARDARLLAEYQAECLASWGGVAK